MLDPGVAVLRGLRRDRAISRQMSRMPDGGDVVTVRSIRTQHIFGQKFPKGYRARDLAC